MNGDGDSEETASKGDVADASAVVTYDDVLEARDRVAEVVHRTPLDRSTTFAGLSGAEAVGLKLENTQRTGSFKIRGAYNAMAQLSPAERERGVVAASAGDLLGIACGENNLASLSQASSA